MIDMSLIERDRGRAAAIIAARRLAAAKCFAHAEDGEEADRGGQFNIRPKRCRRAPREFARARSRMRPQDAAEIGFRGKGVPSHFSKKIISFLLDEY
jgi:hypothetical protein